jgi:hypothetical protein
MMMMRRGSLIHRRFLHLLWLTFELPFPSIAGKRMYGSPWVSWPEMSQLCLDWRPELLTSTLGSFGPCIGWRKAQCSGPSSSSDTTGALFSLNPLLSVVFPLLPSFLPSFLVWTAS